MNLLGLGLSGAGLEEDALSVREADLAIKRRLGRDGDDIIAAQSNLAISYRRLGRLEEALRLREDVYAGNLKLYGEEGEDTILEALNYSALLLNLKRFQEAKSLLRKMIPVARRVLGNNDQSMLRMRNNYAGALYADPASTLDDLREAVTTLEDTERIARRVLGGAHPIAKATYHILQEVRGGLRAREAPSTSA